MIPGMSTYVLVVTSPATCTCPVVISVSTATRLAGSSLIIASRTASLIWSAILSGWPSVTDSEVKSRRATVVSVRNKSTVSVEFSRKCPATAQVSDGSETSRPLLAFAHHDPARGRGLAQGGVVALVLVGVQPGELGDRLLERRRAAEVGGDLDPVAPARVRAGRGPPAVLRVQPQAAGNHRVDGEGELPVAKLPDVEVPGLAVLRLGFCADPAEEDIAGGLGEALAGHHPPSLVTRAG